MILTLILTARSWQDITHGRRRDLFGSHLMRLGDRRELRQLHVTLSTYPRNACVVDECDRKADSQPIIDPKSNENDSKWKQNRHTMEYESHRKRLNVTKWNHLQIRIGRLIHLPLPPYPPPFALASPLFSLSPLSLPLHSSFYNQGRTNLRVPLALRGPTRMYK